MKNNKYFSIICVAVLFALMVFSHSMMRRSYTLPYPHFDSLVTKKNPIQDVAGIVIGARNATADVAWIQLIHYCGEGGHACGHHHDHEDVIGCPEDPDNPDTLRYLTTRIVRINHYFYESYLFGSGILAWYVNRPDEALEILKEGVRNNPKFWQFRLYIGAITYKKINEFGKMISYLEEAVEYEDCPLIIKAILANSYKKLKQYLKAIAVWESILDTSGTQYREMAQREIEEMRRLLNSGQ